MSTDSQRSALGAGRPASAVTGEQPEMPVMAKELVDHFAAQGIKIHYAYARAIIRDCPHAIRGRYVRASDAWTWWVLHPEFKPFGVKPPEVGGTRTLSELAENS